MYFDTQLEKALKSCKDDIAMSWDDMVDKVRDAIDEAYTEGYKIGFNDGYANKENELKNNI